MYSFVLVPAVLSVVKKGCILHTKVQNIKLYSYSTLAAAPAAPPLPLHLVPCPRRYACCPALAAAPAAPPSPLRLLPCPRRCATAAPTLATTALLPLPLPLRRTAAVAAPRAAAAAAAAPHGRLWTWSVVRRIVVGRCRRWLSSLSSMVAVGSRRHRHRCCRCRRCHCRRWLVGRRGQSS
jgi:hypothetical protein